MMDKFVYYLLLGSNVGERALNLKLAILKLKEAGFKLDATSSIYETEPWGGKTNLPFLNISVRARSQIKPESALYLIKKIERELGRNDELLGKDKYSARIIDIDIIFVEGIKIASERLQIPHPLAHKRLFALIPLSEVVLLNSDAYAWLKNALKSFKEKEPQPKRLMRNFLVK